MIIIKVTNQKSKQHIQFMDNAAFNTYVGIPCEQNRLDSSTNGIYAMISHSGLTTLPSNNNITYKGIDQDGTTFLSNNYDPRHIIVNFYMDNHPRLNQILYQEDMMLKIDIQTDIAIYSTYGSVIGSYGGGTVEFLCDPFFSLDERQRYMLLIQKDFEGQPFLPLTMPRVWFESSENNRELIFEVGISGIPTIVLEGIFLNPTISNVSTGQTASFSGVSTVKRLVINTENQTVTSDGVNVLPKMSGFFPELITGQNKFVFSFEEQLSDVQVTIEFAEVTSYVI